MANGGSGRRRSDLLAPHREEPRQASSADPPRQGAARSAVAGHPRPQSFAALLPLPRRGLYGFRRQRRRSPVLSAARPMAVPGGGVPDGKVGRGLLPHRRHVQGPPSAPSVVLDRVCWRDSRTFAWSAVVALDQPGSRKRSARQSNRANNSLTLPPNARGRCTHSRASRNLLLPSAAALIRGHSS